MTCLVTKFSEAMSSMPSRCLFNSLLIRLKTAESYLSMFLWYVV